jgi:hypothetical protein
MKNQFEKRSEYEFWVDGYEIYVWRWFKPEQIPGCYLSLGYTATPPVIPRSHEQTKPFQHEFGFVADDSVRRRL